MISTRFLFKELTSKIAIFLFSFELYVNHLSVEIEKGLCRSLFIKKSAVRLKICIFVNNRAEKR